MPKGRLHAFTYAAAVFFALAVLLLSPSAPQAKAEAPLNTTVEAATGKDSKGVVLPAAPRAINTPVLSIPIPELKFSDIKVVDAGEKKVIDVPWIAQYISSIYKYSIGLATTLATVMFMVGGFQYLTSGGDAARVTAGKKRITDALVGLVLLFGSYAILNLVNPDALTLSALRVQVVKADSFKAQDLGGQHTDRAVPGTNSGRFSGYDYAQPHRTPPLFSSCPVELSAASDKSKPYYNDPRTIEFVAKIKPLITGTNSEKIEKAAEAALTCGIHFGSCGGLAGATYALSGIGDPSCLSKAVGIGECRNHETTTAQTGMPNSLPLRKVLCKYKDLCCKQYKDCNIDNTGCAEDKTEAYHVLVTMLKEKYPGYPDIWADKLQPGDVFWTFAGNDDCGGQHSQVFLGWGTKPGFANIIQGTIGKNPYETAVCIKDICGPNTVPLTIIMHPR